MESHFKIGNSKSKEVVNSEELHFTEIQKELTGWKIPTVPTNAIYKEGKFSIKTDYAIKNCRTSLTNCRWNAIFSSSLKRCYNKTPKEI